MITVSEEKFERFKKRIDDFTLRLQQHGSLRVQLAIDDSYYLQKREELIVLESQRKLAQSRLNDLELIIASHYKSTYCRWRRDVRWLSNHLQQQQPVIQ